MVKNNKFAACTERPWQFLIPKDKVHSILNKVKQECISIYGYDFNQCTNRLICFGKFCLGRELEWKSLTALPYLKKFAKIVNIKEGEPYIIETSCNSCSINKTCNRVCRQMNDYMNRDKQPEIELNFKDNLENIITEYSEEVFINNLFSKKLEIPWDCLTDRKSEVVKKYLYEQKDFLTVAKETGLYDQSAAKYEFYSALTKLSEFAQMRRFLEENKKTLTPKQKTILKLVYIKGYTMEKTAEKLNISKQAVNQTIKKIIANYNIKWYSFVRKENGKVIYNVPKIFK